MQSKPSAHVTFTVSRDKAELLYAQVTDLAEATIHDAEDEHDHRIAHALGQIADVIGETLDEGR